jgi:hypothetical protein
MQAEQLQNAFGIGSKQLEFFVRFLRFGDFHEFHLIELMHTNDATRVASRCARFAPEAGCIGSEFFREIGDIQDLLTVEIC